MRTLEAMRPEKGGVSHARRWKSTLIANRPPALNCLTASRRNCVSARDPAAPLVLAKAVRARQPPRRDPHRHAACQAPPGAGHRQSRGRGPREAPVAVHLSQHARRSTSPSQVIPTSGRASASSLGDRPTCYPRSVRTVHAFTSRCPASSRPHLYSKGDGYQSLQYDADRPFGTPVEIQIRDAHMHHVAVAEFGVASN